MVAETESAFASSSEIDNNHKKGNVVLEVKEIYQIKGSDMLTDKSSKYDANYGSDYNLFSSEIAQEQYVSKKFNPIDIQIIQKNLSSKFDGYDGGLRDYGSCGNRLRNYGSRGNNELRDHSSHGSGGLRGYDSRNGSKDSLLS
ncbi:7928_t:CDS:2 [Funneliformis mosseae]|uniref:7928_t:CDS:1 n=1 Tax=Funneliformis mosseae TaxID=27381 RepID=A0A9N9D4M0_FUNMO|nr:7928_t:CDS:2 [Funneliformis mosseae]